MELAIILTFFALVSYGLFRLIVAAAKWAVKDNPNYNKKEIKMDESNNNKFSTSEELEYAPAVNTKKLILTNEGHGKTIYQDFSNKYILQLKDGKISLKRFHRTNESMTEDTRYYNLMNCGKYGRIEEILLKGKIEDRSNWRSQEQIPVPHTGYIFRYITENGTNYMRLLVSSYVLDASDSLKSITVDYSSIK